MGQWASCDTLYSAPAVVCCSAMKVKILKVISRVRHYCSLGPGRPSEPKQQSWLERPLKINLNSLWHRTFIYPTDTGSVAQGCLSQPYPIFHIFTLVTLSLTVLFILKYFVSVCLCVCERVFVRVPLLYVCDKSVIVQLCLGQSLRNSYFVQ